MKKNIVALLYFILSLDEVSDDSKPKIIVFDDPMTSNDDTMQYLMISSIQNLYEKLGKNYFVLLTHNCHFYLNVQNSEMVRGSYGKYSRSFHLLKSANVTKIKQILNEKDDFKTNYELLWKELLFLYEENRPDLMLSCCRRICETFIKFNKFSKKDFYNSCMSAKKLFDTNSHSIDDLDAEMNGRTKEQIRDILQELFKANSVEQHFNSYWKI